uniref:Uncharacterized protein n=1 Tax=Arion vulgaris TaxID=1028688 RepID=A0A0B6Z3H0_9EUPU
MNKLKKIQSCYTQMIHKTFIFMLADIAVIKKGCTINRSDIINAIREADKTDDIF